MSEYSKKIDRSAERREPTAEEMALDRMVRDASSWFFECPALDAIAEGKLKNAQWKQFSVERYTAASDFVELLKIGIKTAAERGDAELAHTLQANLNDELGIDAEGVQHASANHETWRKNFYRAIGVSDAALEEHKVHPEAWLPGTRRYHEAVKDLIAEGNALAISGALFALEATIPTEFQKIQIGSDRRFPNLTDDERLYLKSHIEHDATSHYPDLQKALAKYVADESAFKEIQRGVEAVMKAKGEFYQNLEEIVKE